MDSRLRAIFPALFSEVFRKWIPRQPVYMDEKTDTEPGTGPSVSPGCGNGGGKMKIYLRRPHEDPGTRRRKTRSRPPEPGSIDARIQSARLGVVIDQTLESEESSSTWSTVDERSLWLREALRRLPDADDRKIMVMRFFLARSLADIAKQIRLPDDEVRRRYRRSLCILDQELSGRF